MYTSRSDFWDWALLQNDISDLLKRGGQNRAEIFCKYVHVVNIELSSFCNRKCSYCPLSTIDRKQSHMSDELFHRILGELKVMNYRNHFGLNLYNEPLADHLLCGRIKEIKATLPYSYVQFNSNGDYLTTEMLEQLKDAGLDQILVTLHTPATSKYIDEDRINAVNKFLDKLGRITWINQMIVVPNKNITIDVKDGNMRFLLCCNNWAEYGNSRGGEIKELCISGREQPCVYPFREVCISYDGYFKPCCNVYFGEEANFGDLKRQSLLDAYFSNGMIEFRRHLFDFSPKKRWCSLCNQEDDATIESNQRRRDLLMHLNLEEAN